MRKKNLQNNENGRQKLIYKKMWIANFYSFGFNYKNQFGSFLAYLLQRKRRFYKNYLNDGNGGLDHFRNLKDEVKKMDEIGKEVAQDKSKILKQKSKKQKNYSVRRGLNQNNSFSNAKWVPGYGSFFISFSKFEDSQNLYVKKSQFVYFSSALHLCYKINGKIL